MPQVALRQRLQEQTDVADHRHVRAPVEPHVPGAAVDGDQRRAAPDVPAVVEPEIAGHAGQQHAVGLAQRLAPLVAQLQRMLAPEQAARHARQVDRNAQLLHCLGDLPRLRRLHHGLAADHHQRALRLDKHGQRLAQVGRVGRARHLGRAHMGHRRLACAGEHFRDMPRQVEPQQPLSDRAPLAGGLGIPLADRVFVVQQVDRAFDEHRPGNAAGAEPEGLVDSRPEIADPADAAEPLDMGCDQRALVDVLQRAAALQCRGGRAAEQDQR